MEQFVYNKADLYEQSQPWNGTASELSTFDMKLRQGWDQALENGHFRYKLDIEETKVIGDKNYVAQLNIKRAQERRKPDEINTLNQPFNPNSFNFTKIKEAEILFDLRKHGHQICAANEQNDETKQPGRNLVIINVSPLEYGHVLLVPNIDDCLPQVLTQSAIQLGLETMLLSKHRGYRVGFNSLCAFASVNHQHLHAYYLEAELFVESSPVQHVTGPLYELLTMPTKGFAFQLHGSNVMELSRLIFSIADYFQQTEVAHNLFMVKGPVFNEGSHSTNRTTRVYLWPRKKFIGLKDEAAFNVALVELAGHLPIKVKNLFDELDEKKVEETIASVALDDQEYDTIKQDVINICQQQTSISH